MRPALRGTIATALVAGLVTSSLAAAVPAGAADPAPAKSKVRLAVVHTPNIGRTCVVGVTVTTAMGQLGGATVVVDRIVNGRWTKLTTVTSRKTRVVRVEVPGSIAPVKFRAYTKTTAAVAGDISNFVTCKPKALGYGSASSTVKKVQKKLRDLRIRPASRTGVFDSDTVQAVYAFQKARGMKRTGTVDAKTYTKLMATKKMTKPAWCDAATVMCVDISKQVGFLLINGKRYVIPVSSGGGYYFYNPQSKTRDFAKTPRGQFRVYYKVPGATTGPLGTYYWISFFTGGYGIHGSASVPTYPASHGCVREPRSIEQWIYRHLPVGASVHVHN